MMYIIKSFDQFYIDTNGDGSMFIETFSPRVATKFTSKKAAEDWIKENTDWETYCEVVPLTESLITDFYEWQKHMTRRTVMKTDKSGSNDYDPSRHTLSDIIQFWVDHSDGSGVSFESYKTWPNLWEMTSHIFSVTKYTDGTFTFEFYFDPKTSTFDSFKQEFYLALRFNPTKTNEDGDLMFDVFDKFLSAGGNSVYLTAVDETRFKVVHRCGSVMAEGNLHDCYNYLLKHRSYGDDE